MHGTRAAVSMGMISVACWLLASMGSDAARPPQPVELQLNDDGGWCWFQDERAVVVKDRLVVGSVATGYRDRGRRGDIDVMSLDLRRGGVTRFPLHRGLEADDHDAPSFAVLADGRLLTMYAKHGSENRFYMRRTVRPADATAWTREEVVVPSETSRVTYSNLHRQRGGRIFQFFRGLDASFKPSWIYSDDGGVRWQRGGILVDMPDARIRHRPYVKYASDGRGVIHLAFTEAHPRDYDNGIHHAMIVGDRWERLGAGVIRGLGEAPLTTAEATTIQSGAPDRVCWIQDMELDRRGRPRLVFSVQMNSAGRPPGQGGEDLRYHFAEWDGAAWSTQEVAYAGRRLYAGEDDYAGGIALHPDDPNELYLSTSVDPVAGTPLPGGKYELFRGRRSGARPGVDWSWEALTPGAKEDQLRPLVPRWRKGRTVLLWLSGTYRSYTDYDLAVRARVW
ncbi:MAG: BNR-4 repeat-containing protein [Verrucomicrobiales bacterium]|nr:BNR-4 repeat-containing protein [Verrucomicrobiales bacterium]